MRTIAVFAALALAAGCKGDGKNGKDDTNEDDFPAAGSCQLNGTTQLPTRDADEIYEGDLADGIVMETFDWAENSYCWPATENLNFTGTHVFFEITQPVGLDTFMRVTPANGVDVSLYALQVEIDSTDLPPNIGGLSCEAGFDQSDDHNPGECEALRLTGWTSEYRVVTGVAGANGESSGKFTLEVWHD